MNKRATNPMAIRDLRACLHGEVILLIVSWIFLGLNVLVTKINVF